jgi:hypothetical protein
MKLYTEEQVKIAYSKGNNDGYCGIQRDFIGLNLMPIKLPSDEEIEKALPDGFPHSDGYDAGKICGFEDGAKWMKEQILNQNK